MDLKECREQLDQIDEGIVSLFNKRMQIAQDVARYKIENGRRVLDKEREAQKLDAVMSMTEGSFNKRAVRELYEQIMAISRKRQYQLMDEAGALHNLPFIAVDHLIDEATKVVYQGAPGSYSEAAMKHYVVAKNFESAYGGTPWLFVLNGGEITYRFALLLGVPGADETRIRTVYSHAQSLMQSERFLSAHPQWQQISMKNNAFAAMKVAKDGDPTQAAIASRYAASCYGLQILREGINQSESNSTRFIIVTNQKIFRKDAKKISLCLEIAHESGSLYRILSHFIYNDLNMTKIESRPIEDKDWEYRFFIDFEGNLGDSAVRNALRGLRDEAKSLKILGNY